MSLGTVGTAAIGVAAGATGTARGAGEAGFGMGVSAGVAEGECFGVAFFSGEGVGLLVFLCAGVGLLGPCPVFFEGDGDFLCVFAAGDGELCGRGVGLFCGLAFGFFGRGVGDSSAESEDSD